MGFHGITEALNWAHTQGREYSNLVRAERLLSNTVGKLEDEKMELNQRLIKLAEDNQNILNTTQKMTEDHHKVVANLIIELETAKAEAAAQAESLVAEVESLKTALATKKTRKR